MRLADIIAAHDNPTTRFRVELRVFNAEHDHRPWRCGACGYESAMVLIDDGGEFTCFKCRVQTAQEVDVG